MSSKDKTTRDTKVIQQIDSCNKVNIQFAQLAALSTGSALRPVT
jgi:hypothetical protein